MSSIGTIGAGVAAAGGAVGLLFYGKEMLSDKKCSWEYIYYMFFLVVFMIIQIVMGGDTTSAMYLTINGRPVNALTQALFFVLPQISMKLIWNVYALAAPNVATTETLFQLLITNQLCFVFGFVCLWFPPLSGLFWIFCILSWLALVAYFYIIYIAHLEVEKVLSTPEEKSLINMITYLFYVVNVAISVWFMIGQDCFALIDIPTLNGLNAFSFLFAKCLQSYLCWRFTYQVYKGPNQVANLYSHNHADKSGAIVPLGHGIQMTQFGQPQVPEKFILVDVNPVSYSIFNTIVQNEFQTMVEAVDSSDKLFEILAASASSTVLISYSLLLENTETLVQSIQFVKKGTKVILYGGVDVAIPDNLKKPENNVMDSIYDQERVRSTLVKVVRPKSGNGVPMSKLDVEMLETMQNIKQEVEDLIGKQSTKISSAVTTNTGFMNNTPNGFGGNNPTGSPVAKPKGFM